MGYTYEKKHQAISSPLNPFCIAYTRENPHNPHE